MKLFVDNNLPQRLARSLAELFDGEHRVEHIRDKFGSGSLADADWIGRLGQERGWCVLTGDRNIARKRPSRELFLRNDLVGFFPAPSLLAAGRNIQAARILMLWPLMISTDQTTSRGCFELPMSGRKLRQMS